MSPVLYALCLLALPTGIIPARPSRSIGTVFKPTHPAPPHASQVPFWLHKQAKFTCRHPGFFADTHNCRIFYKCVNLLFDHFVRYIYKCDKSYLYSIEREACVLSEHANRIECQKKIVNYTLLDHRQHFYADSDEFDSMPRENSRKIVPEIKTDLPHLYKKVNETGGRVHLHSENSHSVREKERTLVGTTLRAQSTKHPFEQNTENITLESSTTEKFFELDTKVTHASALESPSTEKLLERNTIDIYPTTLRPTTATNTKDIYTTTTATTATLRYPFTEKPFEQHAKDIYPTTLTPPTAEILFEEDIYTGTTAAIPRYPSTEKPFEQGTEVTATNTFSPPSTEKLFEQNSEDIYTPTTTLTYPSRVRPFEQNTEVTAANTFGPPSTEKLFEENAMSIYTTTRTFQENTTDNVTNGMVGGCVENGFFSDPYNCSKFYRCVNFGVEYVKYQFSCPNATIWDDYLKTCNFPSQVKRRNTCVYFEPTTTTHLPFTQNERDDSVVDLNVARLTIVCPTGFRAHPKYCNMFYQCTVDKRFKVNFAIFACPEGAIFHEKEGECSRNETAANDREGCTNFQLEEIPDSVQILNVPEGKFCRNQGQFPDGKTCSSKYFRCIRDNEGDLKGFLLDCPLGHVYSPARNRCVPLFLFPFCMLRHF